MKHLNNEESDSWKGPYRPLYQEIYGPLSTKVCYFCQFLPISTSSNYRGAHNLKIFSHFLSSELSTWLSDKHELTSVFAPG